MVGGLYNSSFHWRSWVQHDMTPTTISFVCATLSGSRPRKWPATDRKNTLSKTFSGRNDSDVSVAHTKIIMILHEQHCHKHLITNFKAIRNMNVVVVILLWCWTHLCWQKCILLFFIYNRFGSIEAGFAIWNEIEKSTTTIQGVGVLPEQEWQVCCCACAV